MNSHHTSNRHTPNVSLIGRANQEIDFRNINKSEFKCFQMSDGTVYYGEIAYQSKEDPNQYYFDLEELQAVNPEESIEERKKSVNAIRHGFGIQLYGRNPEAGDKLCYYAGKWDKDLKSGDGSILIFPDGVSQYTGSFRHDKFSGQGILQVKCQTENGNVSKHKYKGTFKEGKLEGHGSFEHGLIKETFGPDFSNNHFVSQVIMDSYTHRRSMSPHNTEQNFVPKVMLDLFNLQNQAQQNEYMQRVNKNRFETAKREKEHAERVRIYRVTGELEAELHEALTKTKEENRTALILTSLE